IRARAAAQRALLGMGTTATVCALREGDLFVAQVGDSRAYLLRGGKLTQLTRDQTLATMLVELGQLAPADVERFEHKNGILQAVGTQDHLQIDLTRVSVRRGDVLLVCSDGLHGPIGDDAIRAVLERETSPARACEALVALANAEGGPDNVTCIVARITGDK